MTGSNRHFKMWVWVPAFFVIGVLLSGSKAVAGSINANEAGVIAAANGTFQYDGKTYKAGTNYINSLESYLMQDDVDLTAEQASSALDKMYASVQQGVEEGYLYEVGSEATTEPVTSGIDLNKDRDKDKNKENSPKEEKNTAAGAGSGNGSVSGGNSGESEAAGQDGSDGQVHLDKDASEELPEEDYLDAVAGLFSDSKGGSGNTAGILVKAAVMAAVLLLIVLIVRLTNVLMHKRKAAPYLLALKDQGLTDLHLHILPGVDDGSKNMENSMKMVEMSYRDGVRRLIVTPHYIANHLQYDEGKLQKVFTMFTERVQKAYPDMECYLGNELYYQGQMIDEVKSGKVHTMAGSKYLLVEFSTKITYHDMYDHMKSIVQARYYPILAHMERFQCLTNHPERMDELAELGVYFQMNADSVLGKGADKKWCQKMLKQNRIQFLGTDAHGVAHRTPEMARAVKWIYEHMDPWDAENLFINNPEMILENKRIGS